MISTTLLTGSAAIAKEDTVNAWTPVGVVSGQWGAPSDEEVDPLLLGTEECAGRSRSWSDERAATTIAVTWYECADHLDLAAAELDDRRREAPARWRSRGYVLGEGLDIAEPRFRAHQRSWVEDSYQITVYGQCLFAAESRCLELTKAATLDLSRRIPGEPSKTAGKRSEVAQIWTLSVMMLWLMVLGAVAAWRRLLRGDRVYSTHPDGARWTNVDREARSFRLHMRLRRYGVVLAAPTVATIFVVIARSVTGTLDIATLASVFINLVFGGIVGVVLLAISRSPVRGDEWRWQVQKLDLPWARRVVSTGFSAASSALLLLLVLLFLAGVGAGRVVALPRLMEAALQMLFFGLLLVAVPASGLMRRRASADAWRSLNSRSGPPIVLLRDSPGQAAKLRASLLAGSGAMNYVGSLLKPQRKQRFDEVLANLLVRQGPVLAVQAPGASSRRRGPTTVAFPVDGRSEAVEHAVTRAQAVVLVAAPPTAGLDTIGVTRYVAHIAREKPLLIILPPVTRRELSSGWMRWYQALSDVTPVADLDPALVADGTHVLVHLPGHGWYAWGARTRDEWTYTQAVHDALAFASASIAAAKHAAEQIPTETDDIEALKPERLEVVASVADQRTAEDIAKSVSGMGRPTAVRLVPIGGTASGSEKSPATAVVLISAAALAEPGWRAAVKGLVDDATRPVPVVIGEVDAGSVPQGLDAVNWVFWSQEQRIGALAALFAAVSTKPSRYQFHRDLLSRARSWVSNQRSPALLLADREEAEQAASHLADATHDRLARPGALLHDFVTSSVVRARQEHRRRRGMLIGGVASAVITTLMIAGIGYVLRVPADNQRLNALASTVPRISPDRPDWAGLLAGAMMVQGDAEQAETGRVVLRSALDRAWPHGRVGAGHNAMINDMTMVGDGAVLTVDNLGTLTRWDLDTGAVRWRRQLDQSLDHLAATPDGSLVAAVSGRTLHLVHTGEWRHRKVPLDRGVSQVALSADGATAAVADEEGRLLTVGNGPADALHELGRYDDVLDLRAGAVPAHSSAVWALVRTSASQVAIVEAPTGRESEPIRVAPDGSTGLYGAVAADGAALAVGNGGGDLQTGTVGAGLRYTGGRVPGLLDGFIVLPGGGLITAGPAFGVQVVDPRRGIVVGRLQVAQQGVARIRSSSDGRFLLCADNSGVAVWATEGFWPADAGGRMVEGGRSPRVRSGTVAVEGAENGAVSVRVAGRLRFREIVLSGAVTAVSVRGDGSAVLVASDRGEVAEVDVGPAVVVRRWVSPVGGRVEAIGWSPDDQIVVGLASGLWWRVPSCAGCGTDEPLLDALRERLWGCYSSNNLEGITKETRRRLDVRVCESSPRATDG